MTLFHARAHYLVMRKSRSRSRPHLEVRKNGQQKHATCLATLLQNELNCDVARFITHIKPVLQQIALLEGLKMESKTRNIVFQLVLQQCCKTSCMLLLPVLPKL